MLFNLSRKNFKKSIRDYSVYFFTLILGVAVFYIFNAIETQTAMMEVLWSSFFVTLRPNFHYRSYTLP